MHKLNHIFQALHTFISLKYEAASYGKIFYRPTSSEDGVTIGALEKSPAVEKSRQSIVWGEKICELR